MEEDLTCQVCGEDDAYDNQGTLMCGKCVGLEMTEAYTEEDDD